jgi:hypothetical protein
MKKLLLFADAQGTIQFANNAATRFTVNGVIPIAGQFSFGVFVGPAADSLSCSPVLPLGSNTATLGLISAPNPQAYQVPGEPNATVFIQIRMWESRFPNWEAGQVGIHAQTAVRAVVLGPSTGPGTVVWGETDPTKFQHIDYVGPGPTIPDSMDPCVPEPSTITLAILGLGSLLLFRRRKRESSSQLNLNQLMHEKTSPHTRSGGSGDSRQRPGDNSIRKQRCH